MAAVQPSQGMPQGQQGQNNPLVQQVLPPGVTREQVQAMFKVYQIREEGSVH